MHLQMADMMKKMGRNPGMFGRMFGGGPAVPDEAELQRLQSELAGIDPNALPSEIKDMMKQMGDSAAPAMPGLPKGLSGLPGLGGGLPKGLPGLGGQPFRGFPGPGIKKK
jgi:signal recognition particle subunit SRP54